MNRQKIAKELLAVAKELTAAGSSVEFQEHLRFVSKWLSPRALKKLKAVWATLGAVEAGNATKSDAKLLREFGVEVENISQDLHALSNIAWKTGKKLL
jgi:hypothetical protein